MKEQEQCVGQKKSPVYLRIGIIEEKLGELSTTNDNLTARLGNILSNTPPTEGVDAEKSPCESGLEETLHSITVRIETEISRIQNLIGRLTI